MTRKASTVRRRVEQVSVGDDGAARRARTDLLATEEPLEIRVAVASDLRGARLDDAATPVSVTMRTPGADFELAAGFLYTEGLIASADAISSIRYCTDGAQQYNVVSVILAAGTRWDPASLQRNFYQTSSCGVCGKASIEAVMGPACARVESGLVVAPDVVTRLPDALRAAQAVFERTGGLHAAGLFTADGELVRAREDVGRHNAMDKLVGASLLERELPWGERIVMVSGRLSFELVQKAARAGAAVLAGVSAPSSLAVELAEQAGITLCGFVRGGRFNVYAGAHRIAQTVHT
ncbi:formate dehydrogenase accessory sulfurtransferase FdhD [Longimicrobium sp.]|uniref:formate dehydrogenase accessory sulfurtransferase FdhD n=1 Tax=Longimicrobium sp. TaxID=2029185 RepID=UPI002B9A43EF|nr:formate dehydrogenase accessory sulfurtransferase FdhD [Longimicrobium sp.]HSU16841.1 formate dehydrogenase accessory sulfurtransferase FdhD [Longimicrobium sp.]